VLVGEQLLDLAQVRTGAQQFGSEDVTERVWRHVLAVVHASRVDVVAKGPAQAACS
jgi:hypothetical protein